MKRLLEIETGMCYYPVDRIDGEHMFCGAETSGGKRYCDDHLKDVYVPLPPKKTKDIRPFRR